MDDLIRNLLPCSGVMSSIYAPELYALSQLCTQHLSTHTAVKFISSIEKETYKFIILVFPVVRGAFLLKI